MSDPNDRRTPRNIFDPLHLEHRFTVDVAANEQNHLVERYWTKADDGLLQDWRGERVWCNPPFDDLRPWARKAHRAVDTPVIVMLLPGDRTDQAWWHEFIEPFRDNGGPLRTRFLKGRARFGFPPDYVPPLKRDGTPGGVNSPKFGCVVCTWRRE